jgi:nitrogen fixation/metabolism regulation signal transduction histidine kinase
MGYKFLSAGIAVCFAVSIATTLWGLPVWIPASICGLGLILTLLLVRGIVLPMRRTAIGMDLLASQDFGSRLVTVSEPNADRMVRLFNSMIERLHDERLRNMEQDNFLSLLIDASPMGVAMLDFDGRITMTNRAFLKIMGLSSIEMAQGKEIRNLDTPLTAALIELPQGENRVIRHGGVDMYRCWHLSVVQNGFPRRFYLIESLTEEIMKAERHAYGKVIRTISHEVNNTMAGVRSLLQMLCDTATDPDERDLMESCDARCSSMCSFISGYADVVRLPDPVMRDENLNSVVTDMLPFLRKLTDDTISIEFIPAESPARVSIDRSLIEQVIVNIVKNAIEGIAEKRSDKDSAKTSGNISIKTFADRSGTRLEITNDGAQIAEHVATQLFNPFFTTKPTGRGIGLTLIAEILSRHSARYTLATDPATHLTTFTISF